MCSSALEKYHSLNTTLDILNFAAKLVMIYNNTIFFAFYEADCRTLYWLYILY